MCLNSTKSEKQKIKIIPKTADFSYFINIQDTDNHRVKSNTLDAYIFVALSIYWKLVQFMKRSYKSIGSIGYYAQQNEHTISITTFYFFYLSLLGFQFHFKSLNSSQSA